MRPFFVIIMLACWLPATVNCGNSNKPAAPAAAVSRFKDTTLLHRQADSAALYARHGDLVFRTGSDYTSFFFRQLNRNDKTYSHAGIICSEGGRLYVYHALGGEFNPDQKLLKQPLAAFISPEENDGYGIFRNNFSGPEINRCIAQAELLYRRGVMFDLKFDLATDDRMYCSEFVYKCLTRATGRPYPLTAGRDYKGVAPDNLFLTAWCRPVLQVVYKHSYTVQQ